MSMNSHNNVGDIRQTGMINAVEMVNALVKANKQFDFFAYPNKNHGIYGGYTRLHLFTKMTNFIKENL